MLLIVAMVAALRCLGFGLDFLVPSPHLCPYSQVFAFLVPGLEHKVFDNITDRCTYAGMWVSNCQVCAQREHQLSGLAARRCVGFNSHHPVWPDNVLPVYLHDGISTTPTIITLTQDTPTPAQDTNPLDPMLSPVFSSRLLGTMQGQKAKSQSWGRRWGVRGLRPSEGSQLFSAPKRSRHYGLNLGYFQHFMANFGAQKSAHISAFWVGVFEALGWGEISGQKRRRQNTSKKTPTNRPRFGLSLTQCYCSSLWGEKNFLCFRLPSTPKAMYSLQVVDNVE